MATSFGLLNTLSDEQLALMLQQEEFDAFQNHALLVPQFTVPATPKLLDSSSSTSKRQDVIVLDDSASDEEPKAVVKAKPKAHEEDEIGVLDVHELFVKYNKLYFHGLLGAVTVEWSAKMTLCAGLCSWRPNGDCRIKLSSKLLQFRSNKELKETLLHECIHAFLFVTHNNKDRDGHGPEFLKKMTAINDHGNFNISVYHSFRDEVDHYRTHWWQCDKCQNIIKRAMNRPPGHYDWWFPRHQQTCGGSYIKIKSPPPTENKKKRARSDSLGNGDGKGAPDAKKPKLLGNSVPSTPNTSAAPKPSSATPLLNWLKKPSDQASSAPSTPAKSQIIVEELD